MDISKTGMHLYNFYLDKEELFLTNYNILVKSSTEQSFHGFRVSIKKLRTLFRLLELTHCNVNSKNYVKSFQLLFKPAGKIREPQVNLRTFKMYCSKKKIIELYQEYLNHQIDTAGTIFYKELNDFNIELIAKIRKEIKKCCSTIKRKNLQKVAKAFIKDRIKSIIRELENKHNEETFHEVRIYLKEISAIVALLVHIQLAGFTPKLLNKIKQTEDSLGLWHDKSELELSLLRFIGDSEFDVKSELIFKKVLQKISKDNGKFIRKAEDLVQKSIFVINNAIDKF